MTVIPPKPEASPPDEAFWRVLDDVSLDRAEAELDSIKNKHNSQIKQTPSSTLPPSQLQPPTQTKSQGEQQ